MYFDMTLGNSQFRNCLYNIDVLKACLLVSLSLKLVI